MAELTENLQEQELYKAFLKISGNFVAKSFIGPANSNLTISNILQEGRSLRNGKAWEWPLMNAAIYVYQQLASNREWLVAASPQQSPRLVEWLNSAKTIDYSNGTTEYGFRGYLQRKSLDYLIVGRSSCHVKNKGEKGQGELEYIDPLYLTFSRKKKKDSFVSDDERVWTYYSQSLRLRAGDIILDHPIPVGMNRFIPPIMFLAPIATLAWLVVEHDKAALDGRKIRDIFLVNTHLVDQLVDAVKMSVALYAGVDPAEEIGIPVLPVNNPGGNPISDQIAKLGISEIPANFDRDAFWFIYANMISATIGVPLRHFWQDERGSNRALEVVQEQRGQVKGPNTFVRAEQELINTSGMLDKFKANGKKARFGFVEEVDVATKKANAEVLLKNTQALGMVRKVFGDVISIEGYLAWMQAIGSLPNELTLIKTAINGQMVEESNAVGLTPKEGEDLSEGLSSPNAFSDTAKSLIPDYDEIVMNNQGQVIERRMKVFSMLNYFKDRVKTEEIDVDDLVENAFDAAINETRLANAEFIKNAILDDVSAETIEHWSLTQTFFDLDDIKNTLSDILDNNALTQDQHQIISTIIRDLYD